VYDNERRSPYVRGQAVKFKSEEINLIRGEAGRGSTTTLFIILKLYEIFLIPLAIAYHNNVKEQLKNCTARWITLPTTLYINLQL